MRYVVDTSVVAAWYLDEEFSDAAREWQQRLLDGQIQFVVPEIHYWEFGNVLRTWVRRARLARELALEIWELHLDTPLVVESADRSAVLEVALELEATVYDAVFISLSRSLDIPLLTAERTTTPWVTKLGKNLLSVRG